MTWLCTLCFSMGVLLFLAACVFCVLRIARMGGDEPERATRLTWCGGRCVACPRKCSRNTSEPIEDRPTPQQGKKR